MDITKTIKQETVDALGIEFINVRLDELVRAFDVQAESRIKTSLGNKIFNYRDIPEVVTALEKIDTLENNPD